MNRESEAQLLVFCVEQRRRFDPSAWNRFSAVTRVELAAVARYLAGSAWYGHASQLRTVADGLSHASFAELAEQAEFDPSRFGGLLKAHLCHAGQTVAA